MNDALRPTALARLPRGERGGLAVVLAAASLAALACWILSPPAPAAAAVATVGGGLIAAARGSRPVPEPAGELRRHLARCRRLEQPADVLVVRLDRHAPDLRPVFRITDTVDTPHGGAGELRAVLDAPGLDRAGLERRLGALAGGPLRFGWASFPADGVTVDALVAVARENARPAHHRPDPVRTTANAST